MKWPENDLYFASIIPSRPGKFHVHAEWLVFAGGYEVDVAMCVPLIVRTGGREQQVRIGVGTGCPPS